MKFEIIGKPLGKGRPRVCRFGTYTPKATTNYENLAKISFLNQCNDKFIDTPIKMEIWAIYEPTKTEQKSKKKYESLLGTPYTKKPDADNVAKIICDALNDVAYDDDNKVSELIVHKLYGKQAKAIVEITKIEKE